MSTHEWTQLVQRVDGLINELKKARNEAAQWRTRAIELERLKDHSNHDTTLHAQAKDRELEKYRKERKKMLAMVSKLIAELDAAQNSISEQEANG
ncbi:hypothetical protein K8S19_11415 [bacterium]|nr:hypothetical protein [bacterium]